MIMNSYWWISTEMISLGEPAPERMEKETVTRGWVKNGPLRLHYVDNNGRAKLTPLVVASGFASTAEDFVEIAKSLLPRHCVSLSLRGRGKSDTPGSGYSLDDHARDIASLVAGLEIKDICVLAHSRGVPYAIRFATGHRRLVNGLVLLDYPARHSRPSQDWADSFLSSSFGKSAVPGRVRLQTVKGVQAESYGEQLWEELGEFDFPVLIIRGGKEDSVLTDEDADLYTKYLKHGRVELFEESSHDMWRPDYGKFIRTLKDFLSTLDQH